MSDKMHFLNQPAESAPARFSPEWIATRSTLEIEATLDAQPILDRLNAALGTKLSSRPDGFHITVIGPMEKSSIGGLSPEQVADLKRISDAIRQGRGISISGIGYIDGATTPGMRDADKKKKTAFIALESPAIDAFRANLGLSKKDLHVTLGFEENDIHLQVVGTEMGGKGKPKDITAPIPKKADPALAGYLEDVQVGFGEIDGKEEEKAAEKPKPAEKRAEAPKEYDPERLRNNLAECEREGKVPAGAAEAISELILAGNFSELGKKFGKYLSGIRAIVTASEKNG